MIVQIISDLVATIPTGGATPAFPVFFHGDDAYNNLQDDTLFPAWFLFNPIISNDTIKSGGYMEEEYPLKMLIAYKSEVDFTPTQHQVLIDQARDLSRKFLAELFKSSLIRFIKNVKRTEISNLYDANMSGVFLEVTVTPFNHNTNC